MKNISNSMSFIFIPVIKEILESKSLKVKLLDNFLELIILH